MSHAFGASATAAASDAAGSQLRAASAHPPLGQSFVDHVKYARGQRLATATAFDRYVALALTVRDRLMDRWTATEEAYERAEAKRVHYLSAEFLTGRALLSNVQALGVETELRAILSELCIDFDQLADQEPEPGLGNGGLGRLAACFMESLATLSLPAVGHGIRYEFGIFEQDIVGGEQVERADEWLRYGNPWEIARPEHAVHVGFGGATEIVPSEDGGYRLVWTPRDTVVGVPHEIPVAGHGTDTVNTLRLWAAKSSRELDLALFNAGDYVRAVEGKNASEVISKVLYPNDNFEAGRELRLRQEYFFASCAVQDVVRRHVARYGRLDNFADKNALQLNDTHPAIAVAELMRLFVDKHRLPWKRAFALTRAAFGFTNHTLMPEALETWPVSLMKRLLPRHVEIIEEIDQSFSAEVAAAFPNDSERADRMAIVADEEIHMARLAVVGSHAVNGVAELHSELLRTRLLADFAELYPGRFSNKTNGVTPRRWLTACNPQLASFVTERIGSGWTRDLERLRDLEAHLDDPAFLTRLRDIKAHHKHALAQIIADSIGLSVDPASLFDVQIKRLHEYKRQLLNVLHIAALYLRAKAGEEVLPRTFIFGAKAAPGYQVAKHIIRLIHAVGDVVNASNTGLRVAFLPNYRVTLAERIIPAADLSEQISTAGLEASGTGNMKLALNGALTVGTLDGANIEIRAAVGADNFFLFGMDESEVAAYLEEDPAGERAYFGSPLLREVVDHIGDGYFNPDEPELFRDLMDGLLANDPYCVFADFDAYVAIQDVVAACYQNEGRWRRMAALNIARVGRFSSDRTIREYARDIWHLSPVTR